MNAMPLIEQVGALAAMGGGAGGGFLAVKWLIEWMAGRLDKREARIDAGTDKLIQGLERQIEGLTRRLEAVEKSLADCQVKHAESEAEVLKLKAIIDGKGEIAQRAALVAAADRLGQRKDGTQ